MNEERTSRTAAVTSWTPVDGVLREGVPQSTAVALAGVALEFLRVAPWRRSSETQWFRIEGIDASAWHASLGEDREGRPWLRLVSVVEDAPELWVFFLHSSDGQASSDETRPSQDGRTVLPREAAPAVVLNAGRQGSDALGTREEMLVCISVLRMLSLVPLADGKPFVKRFVSHSGAEAHVSWPHDGALHP